MSWYPDLEGIALAQQINWPPVQSNEYVWMVQVQNISLVLSIHVNLSFTMLTTKQPLRYLYLHNYNYVALSVGKQFHSSSREM